MIAFIFSWWFLLSVAFFGAILLCEAKETFGGLTLALILYLLGLQFFGGVDIFNFVKSNTLDFSLWVVAYLVAGTAWSVGKWTLFVFDRKEQFLKLKDDFYGQNNLIIGTNIPANLKEKWVRWLSGSGDFPPKASKNKYRITRWMLYWPASLLWTMLNDFLHRVFNAIYNLISNFLQAISNKIFANTQVKFDE